MWEKTLGLPKPLCISPQLLFFCFQIFNLHNKELTVKPVKRIRNTSHLTEESWHVFFEHIWTRWEDGKWSHAASIVRNWNHAGCCRHDAGNVSCQEESPWLVVVGPLWWIFSLRCTLIHTDGAALKLLLMMPITSTFSLPPSFVTSSPKRRNCLRNWLVLKVVW